MTTDYEREDDNEDDTTRAAIVAWVAVLDPKRFLMVHGTDAQKWAARYALTPVTAPCRICGRIHTTTLPFAVGLMRGLVAPPCECGSLFPVLTVVWHNHEEARVLSEIKRYAVPSGSWRRFKHDLTLIAYTVYARLGARPQRPRFYGINPLTAVLLGMI